MKIHVCVELYRKINRLLDHGQANYTVSSSMMRKTGQIGRNILRCDKVSSSCSVFINAESFPRNGKEMKCMTNYKSSALQLSNRNCDSQCKKHCAEDISEYLNKSKC